MNNIMLEVKEQVCNRIEFETSSTVSGPIANVTDFYTQIKHLELITYTHTSYLGLRIIQCPSSSSYMKGSILVTLSGKLNYLIKGEPCSLPFQNCINIFMNTDRRLFRK